MKGKAKKSKGERTRERIFFRAGNLFAEKGYQAISVDEIIDGLGIAKGTMYQYFDGKNGLLKELLQYSHDQITAVFDSIQTDGKECRAVIRETYFRLNRLYSTTFDMIALGLSCSGIFSEDDAIPFLIETLQNGYKKVLKPFNDDFRVNPVEIPFVVFLQGEFIRGHLQYHFGSSGAPDEDILRIIDFTMDLLENGIFTRG
ncbi:MAG: TetR/AcrR family transcriptional regulator [Spirochaetota bacterium]